MGFNEMTAHEKAQMTYKDLQKRRAEKHRKAEKEVSDFNFKAVERCKKLRHDRRY